jgi:hypothetical protein
MGDELDEYLYLVNLALREEEKKKDGLLTSRLSNPTATPAQKTSSRLKMSKTKKALSRKKNARKMESQQQVVPRLSIIPALGPQAEDVSHKRGKEEEEEKRELERLRREVDFWKEENVKATARIHTPTSESKATSQEEQQYKVLLESLEKEKELLRAERELLEKREKEVEETRAIAEQALAEVEENKQLLEKLRRFAPLCLHSNFTRDPLC